MLYLGWGLLGGPGQAAGGTEGLAGSCCQGQWREWEAEFRCWWGEEGCRCQGMSFAGLAEPWDCLRWSLTGTQRLPRWLPSEPGSGPRPSDDKRGLHVVLGRGSCRLQGATCSSCATWPSEGSTQPAAIHSPRETHRPSQGLLRGRASEGRGTEGVGISRLTSDPRCGAQLCLWPSAERPRTALAQSVEPPS